MFFSGKWKLEQRLQKVIIFNLRDLILFNFVIIIIFVFEIDQGSEKVFIMNGPNNIA